MRLSQLQAGQSGTVGALRLPPETAAALGRLGLVPGTRVRLLRRTPFGGPAVFRFRGTDLALRGREAAGIFLAKAAQSPGKAQAP